MLCVIDVPLSVSSRLPAEHHVHRWASDDQRSAVRGSAAIVCAGSAASESGGTQCTPRCGGGGGGGGEMMGLELDEGHALPPLHPLGV